MFKIFRWNVLVKFDPGRFFVPVTTSVYLSGITTNDDRKMSVPQFSSINPVLYRKRDARFLVRELRRSGYYAYMRPWIFFAIRQRRLAKQSSAWK